MKTIGISTICKSENYGACLQSFALYQYLTQIGMKVSVIDFLRPGCKKFKRSSIDKEKGKKHDISKFNIRQYAAQLVYDIRDLRSKRIRKRNFSRFNSRINFTSEYISLDELYYSPPQFDIYITGSDQVWCPTREFANDPFLLTFAPVGSVKIAYAPSISIGYIPDEYKELYQNALNEYKSISVRENEASGLLLNEFGLKNVPVVLDPTFLLDVDFWATIAKKPKYENYILFYPIGSNKQLLDYAIEVSKKIGKQLLYLRPVTNSTLKSSDYISINDAGPEEMLGLIKHASAVLTDSYHGVIFSVLFRVPFYLHIKVYGSRYKTLNEKIDINNNILKDFNPDRYTPVSVSDKTIELLEKEIEYSKKYLNTMIDV